MKYLVLLSLFACASKNDFRDPKRSVLVCSTIATTPVASAAKVYHTWPVQWRWEELAAGDLRLFRHERTLKAFLPHRLKEDRDPHQAIAVWNFELEKGYDTAFIKRELQKAAKKLEFNNLFDPPAIRRAKFTGGDFILINAGGIKDKNYDQGHLVHSFNRTTLAAANLKPAEAGEYCLKRLEDDPPQVQEDEELKLEILSPL